MDGDGPPPSSGVDDTDLYGLLDIDKDASPDDIKKAYRKAALQYHPDKVPEEMREESEVKFKSVSQAYEILKDEEKRHMYDTHGMAAFDPSRGGGGAGPEVDLDDILSQMFGFNMGGGAGMGGPGMGGPGGGRRKPRRGPDEEQQYKVTLEELYKGKTVKFAADKQVVCGGCKGTGGKPSAKPNKCDRCKGAGMSETFQQIGPGLVRKATVVCDRCEGSGDVFKDKDRCKKCKGKRTTSEKKVLEIYVPRGAADGERIVLEGEADQHPDHQSPGDIIFHLDEESHDDFVRAGHDLSAEIKITLAEALGGFSRTVLTHLDGRGIHVDRPRGKIVRPGDVFKVPGEGMPLKRGEAKGDLYLIINVVFPEDGWLKDDKEYDALAKILPGPAPPIKADEVDDVDYESDADIEKMGTGQSGKGGGGDWEDLDEEEEVTQCQTQ